MSVSTPAQSTNTVVESEIDLMIQEPATEVIVADIELSLPDSSQLAAIRAMSEACLHSLQQSAEAFSSQSLPKDKLVPSETLLAKDGLVTKSASLPMSQAKLPGSTSLIAKGNISQQSKEQPGKAEGVPFSLSFVKQQAEQVRTIKCQLELPRQDTQCRELPTQLCKTEITIKAFEKPSMKDKSEEFLSKEQKASSPLTTRSEQRAPLSPMALFAHVNKEASEYHLKMKGQDGERRERQGEKDQGERENQQEHKRPKVHGIEKTSSSSQREVLPVTKKLPKELVDFALSESQLSSMFDLRVSHLDVLKICAEIMKLMLHSKHSQHLERRETRKLFAERAKDVADSYEHQATVTKWLGVATAVLGLFGAVSPLAGEICGDALLGCIQSFGFWKNVSSSTFFNSMGRTCSSMAQLSETVSRIYDLQENAHRTMAENQKELMRIEHDEISRSIEDAKDHWKSMENFLLQILQTEHETTRGLYQ